jgi:hypothetical protein
MTPCLADIFGWEEINLVIGEKLTDTFSRLLLHRGQGQSLRG